MSYRSVLQGMLPTQEEATRHQEFIHKDYYNRQFEFNPLMQPDYMDHIMSNLMNLFGSSMAYVSPEDIASGVVNIGGPIWRGSEAEIGGANISFGTAAEIAGIEGSDVYCYTLEEDSEEGFAGELVCSPSATGYSSFENLLEFSPEKWLESYGMYIPEFSKDARYGQGRQTYSGLLEDNEREKDALVQSIMDRNVRSNYSLSKLYGKSEFDKKELQVSLGEATSRLKDVQTKHQINSLFQAYENDLYSIVADLAETGAFDFINLDPEYTEFISETDIGPGGVEGCMDPLASNYDPNANVNSGCQYV